MSNNSYSDVGVLANVIRDSMNRQAGLGTHTPARSAVHAVLDLHQPDVYPGYSKRSKRRHCVECHGYDGEHGGRIVGYPCPTIEVICVALDIDPQAVAQWLMTRKVTALRRVGADT